jgi:hypothetical protein
MAGGATELEKEMVAATADKAVNADRHATVASDGR